MTCRTSGKVANAAAKGEREIGRGLGVSKVAD
jgi:hypothetical protein